MKKPRGIRKSNLRTAFSFIAITVIFSGYHGIRTAPSDFFGMVSLGTLILGFLLSHLVDKNFSEWFDESLERERKESKERWTI